MKAPSDEANTDNAPTAQPSGDGNAAAVASVIFPLGRLLPPDPPQKWNAISEALSDDDKTRRLSKLLVLVVIVPLALVCLVVIGLALVFVFG
jgi:hypothetical protein